MTKDILIIDDEADIRNLIQGILEDEGYTVRQAANDEQAYAEIRSNPPQLIVLDIWLQNSAHDGIEILKEIKKDFAHLPVLMISGHGTIETAVSAIKEGAYDFIEKPFKSDRLLLMIERALETAQLRKENETLRAKADGQVELVGNSGAVQSLIQVLDRVAVTNSRVLLSGEAGVGKDVAARYIHKNSGRNDQPFVVLNCATLQPDRLEEELFGIAAGNSHGQMSKEGLLEKANGGTLLLDEVADMPLETQGKILRVLQDQKFERIGGQEIIEVDVRILASTNRDLQAMMDKGEFRQELYYRLNVVPVNVPPLREHAQDIKPLCHYFLKSFSTSSGLSVPNLDEATYVTLQAYGWPGNVRQLKNVMEWLMIMNSSEDGKKTIKPENLPPEISKITSGNQNEPQESSANYIGLSLREAREIFEKQYLEAQVRRFGGNISQTAQFVGMERSALHRKMKQLGLNFLCGQGDSSSSSKTGQNNQRKRA